MSRNNGKPQPILRPTASAPAVPATQATLPATSPVVVEPPPIVDEATTLEVSVERASDEALPESMPSVLETSAPAPPIVAEEASPPVTTTAIATDTREPMASGESATVEPAVISTAEEAVGDKEPDSTPLVQPRPGESPRRAEARARRHLEPSPRPHVPAIHEVLVCRGFEDNQTVSTRVVIMDAEHRQMVVWIDALRRHWPVAVERVFGKTWKYVASDYPPPGEDARFDAQFRTAQRVAGDEEVAAAPAAAPFSPPRKARPGYVWAKTTIPVTALGFQVDKNESQRRWGPDETGEFPLACVKGSTSAFKTL